MRCTGEVLVLGEDTRIVLAIARCLGRRDIDVHVGWCPPAEPALRSRYVRHVHNLRHPANSDAWREDLRAVLASESFDLVVPATEVAMYALQLESELWQNEAPFYLLSRNAFHTTIDKLKTYQLAETLAIAVPKTVVISRHEYADRIVDQVGLPAVVKPHCSIGDSDLMRKNFTRTVHTCDELRDYVQDLEQRGNRVLIQEHVQGKGVGVEVLADEGKILFAFQHMRLHETNGYGSTYRKSTPVDPALLDAAARILETFKYIGVAMVEFKVDSSMSRWVLLEINGRFWGSLPLAVAAGAEFPHYLYEMLVNGKTNAIPRDYRIGVRCRNLFTDLRWMARNLGRPSSSTAQLDEETLGWQVNSVSRWQLALDFLRIVTFRDHIDTFAVDDPIPGLADTFQICKFVVRRMLRRSLARNTKPGVTASMK